METKPLQWPIDWTTLSRFDRFFLFNPFWGKAKHIYGDLLDQLDDRTEEDLSRWEKYPVEIRELFDITSPIIIEYMEWPETSLFLPDDPADILFWGRVDFLDVSYALMCIEEELEIEVSDEFCWDLRCTYAQLLQKFLDEKSRTTGLS